MDEAEYLLDMVTGLGEVVQPDTQAVAEASVLEVDVERDPHVDMRGARDLDHVAAHPWRSA